MALVMALVLIAPITQTFGTLLRTNNGHTVVNADVDPDVDVDASTFNSSRARLNLPTGGSVEFAGLQRGRLLYGAWPLSSTRPGLATVKSVWRKAQHGFVA